MLEPCANTPICWIGPDFWQICCVRFHGHISIGTCVRIDLWLHARVFQLVTNAYWCVWWWSCFGWILGRPNMLASCQWAIPTVEYVLWYAQLSIKKDLFNLIIMSLNEESDSFLTHREICHPHGLIHDRVPICRYLIPKLAITAESTPHPTTQATTKTIPLTQHRCYYNYLLLTLCLIVVISDCQHSQKCLMGKGSTLEILLLLVKAGLCCRFSVSPSTHPVKQIFSCFPPRNLACRRRDLLGTLKSTSSSYGAATSMRVAAVFRRAWSRSWWLIIQWCLHK